MAYTEFYVQQTGSNLNAGSTNDNAALQTYAGGTFVRGTGVFTVASGNPTSDGVTVGTFASIYTTAGATVATCVGRITARDATTITISTTVLAGAVANVSETAAAATCKVGGAWAGPSGTTAFPFAFMTAALINTSGDPPRVNIKGGTNYDITAEITHANNGPIIWEGYTSSVGDGGYAKFFGDSATPATPFDMLTISGTGNTLRRLWFDNNGGDGAGQNVGSNTLVDITGTSSRIERCRFTNAYRSGLRVAGGGTLVYESDAHNNQRDDASNFGAFHILEESVWVRCASYNNDVGTDSMGFNVLSDSVEPVVFIQCISAFNGGNGWWLNVNHSSVFFFGCIAIGNAINGWESEGAIATTSVTLLENCIAYDNTTYGVSMNDSAHRSPFVLRNCAFGANGTPTNNLNASFVSGSITLSADPFTDSVNGDFTLNDTAGGGADCRNAGYSTFVIDTAELTDGAANVGYPDVGAMQHDDTGGAPSGGEGPFIGGRLVM
jgi:hypothetical protein